MATDVNMDVDMDLVFDDELGNAQELDEETARLQREIDELNAPQSQIQQEDAMIGVEDAKTAEEGEVTSNDLVRNKVHVRGVNDLSSRDVQNFAADLYPTNAFKSIEWIDDTSANLVYENAAAASEALAALSASQISDPLELRTAKPLTTHPHIELFVRSAVESDKKKRGAAQVSDFYRHNPIARKRRLDPEDRSRGKSRYDQDRANYRREQVNKGEFSADFYDDDGASRSTMSERELFPKRRRRDSPRDRELFAERPQSARLRNRSASPVRDGDGRFGFSDDQPYRATARYRSPPARRPLSSSQNNHVARDRLRNELFPAKKINHSAFATESVSQSQSQPKELFPDKANHRRQDAKDLSPDEVADAIGRPTAHPRELFPSKDVNHRKGDLFPAKVPPSSSLSSAINSQHPRLRTTRSSSFDSSSANYGRNSAARNGRDDVEEEFSIRGGAGMSIKGGAGLSIRGGAQREKDRERSARGFEIAGAASRAVPRGAGRDLFEGRGLGRKKGLFE